MTSSASSSGSPPVLQVGATGLGGDREARWHRQPEVGHLGEVGALAPEQVALVLVALCEVEHVAHGAILARPRPVGEGPGGADVWLRLRSEECRPLSTYAGAVPPRAATAARHPAGGEVGAALARPARRCRTPRCGSRGAAGPPGRASTASWHPPSKTRQSASSHPPHGGSQSVISIGPGGQREPELLLDLAAGGALRGLAHLDHPAGQVPVLLVGELAQQHPVVGVAHQQLADRPLAGQEGVEQRPEPARLVDRGVGREPRVHDPVGRHAVDQQRRASRPRGACRTRSRPAAPRRRRG